MKKPCQILVMAALMLGSITTTWAQQEDREAIEHELAITAYNYAVGCEERENYEEALVGLSHIPAGRLNRQQQAWADSLRMKCEAMTGHPMAAPEVELTASEQLSIDDQSDTFMQGIKQYEQGFYAMAKQLFTDVMEMGAGPRPQVRVEAIFWRGQCQYQLCNWEDCCKDLILFNDTKDANTDAMCDAKAYYTMGYARMQAKKWHQARLNFERYLDHETDKACATYPEGQSRYKECKALEAQKTTQYKTPLDMQKVLPISGETINIRTLQMKQDTQMLREKDTSARLASDLKDWHAPYIKE